MRWIPPLTKLRTFEIEELRKRLAAVLARRSEAEARLVALAAEAEREAAHARADVAAAWCHAAFRVNWKERRAALEAELRGLDAEERGARDALIEAFEALKKVEKVGEAAAAAAAKDLGRLEGLALDEQALRRARRQRI